MLKIAIVDDDVFYINEIKAHIQRYQTEKGVNIHVTTFTSGFELISDYKPIYDIVLLDIEMPHLNGMEVAKSIRKADPHAVIVFITQTAKYAINGYEVNAFDYMMKPIEYTQFSIKFRAAIDVIDKREDFSLMVPLEDGRRHVKAQEILYIEVKDHWLHIVTKDGELMMLGSLKEMEEKLSQSHFVRCSKSFLINLQHVTRLRTDSVVIQGRYEINMSRAKRKAVQNRFVAYYNEMRW